jgi:thiamine biosynthesis lipoprotein
MSPDHDARPLIRHAFTAFGGAACEVLAGDGTESDVSDLVAEVYAFETQMTRFRPESELSRFNAQAGDRVPVTPLLESLLGACLDAFTLSEGLVNAAVHDAVVRAGYDRSIELVGRDPMPSTAATAIPVAPLPEVLDVADGWARLRSGWAIDLGGVGKGWLADRLCERFDNACVNLGGDLRARGHGPTGEGWSVGLCDGSTVLVRDGAVATSGTTGRRWKGGPHLIDPRTGRPADSDALAVSVAARDCVSAEVLAKAAVILGSAIAGRWLRGHGAVHHAAIWSGTTAAATL